MPTAELKEAPSMGNASIILQLLERVVAELL
ncbi:MAG: hypothetical protein QOI96_727 [Verrucomicrobiota bacterium]|jgi:hypothetical protein